MQDNIELKEEHGFTLIELLIAIVVVGVLSAVAIVGIGGLTDKGKKASCNATRDAAKTAIAVYYANQSTYPNSFTQLTSGPTPALDVPSTVTVSAGALSTTGSQGWTITLTGGGANPPVLGDCPAS